MSALFVITHRKHCSFSPFPLPLRYTLFSFPPSLLSLFFPEVGSLVDGERVRRIAQGGMGFPYWGSHPAVKCGEMHHCLFSSSTCFKPTHKYKQKDPTTGLTSYQLTRSLIPPLLQMEDSSTAVIFPWFCNLVEALQAVIVYPLSSSGVMTYIHSHSAEVQRGFRSVRTASVVVYS